MNESLPEGDTWIRAATTDDVPIVARLIAELLTELSEGDATDETVVYDAVSQALARPGYVILLGGSERDTAAAVLTLEPGFAIYAGGHLGTIRELYVEPSLRSEGLGAALIENAMRHAVGANWNRVEVTLPAGARWARTRTFYQQNGFSDAGPKLRRVF